MDQKIQTDITLVFVFALLGIIVWFIYMSLENKKLKTELSESELQNEKNQNAKDVHALSDADLKRELDKDLSK